MSGHDLTRYAEMLANFIHEKNYDPVTQRTPYYHMGDTITDSILQAGLNYQHVVYPSVHNLLVQFPNYTTTSDFLILQKTFSLCTLLDWKNETKLRRISDLSWFLFEENVENEDQLSLWLGSDKNVSQLKQINGIGPKTIDYLKMLSGNQAIAVDRHLCSFLKLVGIAARTYQEANAIYCKASELLGVSNYELDRKIWLFMSQS